MVVGEEALGAFAGHLVYGVDEEYPVLTDLGFGRPADDDAGLHGRVVEEVRPEAEDAVDQVGLDELLPHPGLLLAEEDAMGEKDGAAAGLGSEARQDVLPEGVVGPALGRKAEEVPSPGIGCKGGPVPLLDRIGGIGEAHVEAHQAVALDQLRLGKGIAADDLEVLDPVKEAVHPGDGGGHEVPLLAVEAYVPPLLALAAQMGDGRKKHPAGAAGGIVDRFPRLGFEHLGHEVDDGAVGVELGGGVAGVVGEFLDQVFVSLAQLVLGEVGEGEIEGAEVLDQVAEHRIGEAVLVGPLRVAEDAVELVGVGRLDGAHGGLEGWADVSGDLPDLTPVGVGRNLEAVVFRIGGKGRITAGFRKGRLRLFVEDIAEPLVEEKRKDELLVVPRIDSPAQERGRAPEIGFELLLCDAGGHVDFFFPFFPPNFSILLLRRSLAKLRTSMASTSLIMPSTTW